VDDARRESRAIVDGNWNTSAGDLGQLSLTETDRKLSSHRFPI
jgi:hypothetical protein